MIDHKKLSQAYDNDGIYSLQLEVGDRCDQGCAYCYMNAVPEEKNTLTDDQIIRILEDSKRLNITSIEWLGGEPLLRPSIFKLMERASDLGFRNNMWTGGLPLCDNAVAEKTVDHTRFGLISVHVSSINQDIYRILHPERPIGDLDRILAGIEKVLELGYPPEQMLNSVTFTGLQTADDMIQTINYFEEKYNILTSLNVYHTYLRPGIPMGELDRFIPDKHNIARVYNRYKKQYNEDDLPMNCVNKQYCSATAAILCDGSVTPCATIREKEAPSIHRDGSFLDIVNEKRNHLIFKRFKEIENLPKSCQRCKINDKCWGCRSRAFAAGFGLFGKDPRCFRS